MSQLKGLHALIAIRQALRYDQKGPPEVVQSWSERYVFAFSYILWRCVSIDTSLSETIRD